MQEATGFPADSFVLDIGGRRARARLLRDAAPATCAAFDELLPLDSAALHAKFAGDELFFMAPVFLPPENEVPNVAPGDLGYYPSRQTVCLFYGDIVPFGRVNVFARVETGLEAIAEAGRALKEEGWLPVRCLVPGRSEQDKPPVPSSRQVPKARGIMNYYATISKARRLQEECWTEEPPETGRLRELSLPPTGNMAARLYANFDLFWAGETLQVLLEGLDGERFTPRETARFAAAMLERFAARLAHWGMEDTVALLVDTAGRLASGKPMARQVARRLLVDLLLYVDTIQTWVDRDISWMKFDAGSPAEERV